MTSPDILDLDLSYCEIDDASVKHIAEVLIKDHKLEHLRLNDNKIRDLAAEYITEALTFNKYLKFINLDSNKIKLSGALTFVELILNCAEYSSLESVDLSWNCIEAPELEDRYLLSDAIQNDYGISFNLIPQIRDINISGDDMVPPLSSQM